MADQQFEQFLNKEVRFSSVPIEPVDFIRRCVERGSVLDMPYKITPNEAQIARQVGFEIKVKRNVPPEEALFYPTETRLKATVTSPPVVPHIEWEVQPPDLSAVVDSDDPSKPPDTAKLKCVEVIICLDHEFANKKHSRTADEIYRVDLTKAPPQAYKQEPIPIAEQMLCPNTGDKIADSIISITYPHPEFRYVTVKQEQFQQVLNVVRLCQQQGSLVL
ncbi:hypothetical protein A3F03_02915 [Candidatus Roizmanbacteria bacterium RIFCSPHIGHO2_12_FULL_41_11]|uniref:Uncharacterized protein n=1 Tax=Candidatus Roizmanbacteria bacterium RIFCSPHIGHO2_12_FULL_41_11 TaxID=1802052 RepID=A0A1F7I4A9_9BACT|nr:MAG: hypothetical protein A3F03_02915 [Candidatus Roizmanbacteria bacterium RIFCSPHIGHO2_12_FULL_41_11]